MISIGITLAATLAFLIVGISSLRWAFFLLVALLPFLPFYFAIPVGGSSGGAGIAAAQLSTFVLFLLLVLSLLLDAKGWQRSLRAIAAQKWFLWSFALLSSSRLISTVINQPLGAVFYWADEMLLLTTVFFLAVRVVLDLSSIDKLGRIFFGIAMIQAVFAFLESSLGHHLLLGVVNIQVSTVGANILDGIVRGGSHRAQTFFDNPLTMAEYMLYMLVAVYFLYRMQYQQRTLMTWCALGLILLAILQTKARFPFVLLTTTIVLFQLLSISTRISAISRVMLLVSIVLGGLAISFLVGYFVFNFDQFLPVLNAMFADETDISKKASIISRAVQYAAIPTEILSQWSAGLLGEGYRSNLIERLDIRLDNYYLRIMIEGGLIALASYITMLFFLVIRSLKAYRQLRYLQLTSQDRVFLKRVYLFFLFFFIQFAFSKMFLSMSFNNYLLFLFAGSFFAVSYRVRQNFDQHVTS